MPSAVSLGTAGRKSVYSMGVVSAVFGVMRPTVKIKSESETRRNRVEMKNPRSETET
jgi:hypothetical protein